MNNSNTAVDPTAPPPQPPRFSFCCDRHPNENFTGFCPSCLCERLTTLDNNNNSSSNTPSTSQRPSFAIKALFTSSYKSKPTTSKQQTASLLPELRRSKSFSASKNEALGLFFEPQRKSCTSTLWNLLNNDVSSKTGDNLASSSHQNPQIAVKIESFRPVFEETENEEDFKDALYIANDGFVVEDDDEIRPVLDSNLVDNDFVEVKLNGGEIVEEEEEEEFSLSNLKAMKDYIDLDTQEEKKGSSGFWAAASVLSKKWQKLRRKQKVKKQGNGGNSVKLHVEKPISRQLTETQSEIADYGYGRRSCDVDPRFSLDAGRISFDDSRYSFEEPRASWDGYMMGRRSFSRMAPTMVSVMEDAPSSVVNVVSRTDMQILLEDSKMSNGDENVPGGSIQTREYYSDSFSRRRKSLDRSSSIRKTAASAVAEIDVLKTVSNSKVSPATADYFQGPRFSAGDREFRVSNSNSLRDDCSEIYGLGNGYRDISNLSGEKELKKSRRPWGWRLWGLIQRRNSNKDVDEDDKFSRVNGLERSYSESWRNGGDLRNRFHRNVFRSNSSVSWRNANNIGAPLASVRNSGFEMNEYGRKKRDEFVLEKNQSARYSSSHNTDNGLL